MSALNLMAITAFRTTFLRSLSHFDLMTYLINQDEAEYC